MKTESKALNIGLWAAQGILAAMFIMAGSMKSTQPIVELSKTMPWTAAVPEGLVRFIGISEFLAALGLTLPAALRIKPMLTPLAAAGLLLVMVLAAGFHFSRGESGLMINLVIGSLAGFVSWGRGFAQPIAPKA